MRFASAKNIDEGSQMKARGGKLSARNRDVRGTGERAERDDVKGDTGDVEAYSGIHIPLLYEYNGRGIRRHDEQ